MSMCKLRQDHWLLWLTYKKLISLYLDFWLLVWYGILYVTSMADGLRFYAIWRQRSKVWSHFNVCAGEVLLVWLWWWWWWVGWFHDIGSWGLSTCPHTGLICPKNHPPSQTTTKKKKERVHVGVGGFRSIAALHACKYTYEQSPRAHG